MTASGITPVVLDEKSMKRLEKMLERQERLKEANRELLMKRARERDFTTVRTLKDIK